MVRLIACAVAVDPVGIDRRLVERHAEPRSVRQRDRSVRIDVDRLFHEIVLTRDGAKLVFGLIPARQDETRRHSVDAHRRREGLGEEARRSFKAHLRNSVAEEVRIQIPELLIEHVYDSACPPGRQRFCEGACNEDGRSQVDREIALPVFEGERRRRVVLENGSIVDDGVKRRAEERCGAGRQGFGGDRVREVRRNRQGADLRGERVSRRRGAAIMNDDPPAAAREAPADRRAEAPRAAGDKRGPHDDNAPPKHSAPIKTA